MTKLGSFLVLVTFTVIFWSCHKDKDDVRIETGTAYYPLKNDQHILYQVDSVIRQGLYSDTVSWEVLEIRKLSDIPGNGGDMQSFIERHYRKLGEINWLPEFDKIETLSNSYHILVKEGNQFFVRLVFPFKEGFTWDGNAYNDFESQEYTMKDIGGMANVGDAHFDETVRVMEKDITTLISQDLQYKIYARDVGEIYAKMIHMINLQSPQYQSGFIVEKRVIQWTY